MIHRYGIFIIKKTFDFTIVELSHHVKDDSLRPFDTVLNCRISIGAKLSVSLHIAITVRRLSYLAQPYTVTLP